MQVVINISKDDYEEICIQARMVEDTGSLFGRIRKAILHGVQLSKGHVRLVDADAINLKDISPVDGFSVYGATAEDIDLTPTVLEAESEDKE
jgi:hypothetical protein